MAEDIFGEPIESESKTRVKRVTKTRTHTKAHSFSPMHYAGKSVRAVYSGIYIVIAIAIAVGLLYGAFLMISGYMKSRDITATYQSNIERLAQHVLLPTDETPRMLLVDDVTKLPPYPFLKQAQKDDVLIVYQAAGVIAVYRPSIDRIVTMSQFQTEEEGSSAAQVLGSSSSTVPKK